MVKAFSHALPPGLSDLGKAMQLPEDQRKLVDGRKLVLKFCKPAPESRKVRRYTRETHPEEWARLIEYAKQDVAAMRRLYNLMPSYNWTETEIALWHLDQKINDRGFQVDVELAKAGSDMADTEKATYAERVRVLTGGFVLGPSKREDMLLYLRSHFDKDLPDLTKDTITRLLKRNDLDPAYRELLSIRLSANKTSTAKYAALLAATNTDARFRGGLQFAGAARTRRFAGRIFQPQNLPSRGLPPHTEVEDYIACLKNGTHDLLFDDLMLFGAAAIRGLVVAPEGKKLAVADLSNIEGRLLAWVAQEDWKIQAFYDYDAGTGPDLYNITAVSIIGGDPWKVAKKDRNVFGKVPDLASGYQGSVPGYQQFAHAYGVRFADYWDTIQEKVDAVHIRKAQDSVSQKWAKQQIESLGISELEWVASESCKLAWRARHPKTVAFWNKIETACKDSLRNPGEVMSVNRMRVATKRINGHTWLLIRLPSGRFLTYFDPKLVDGEYGEGLSYMSMASDEGSTSRAWIRTFTHGGKLTGNICQTLAGDLLKDAMPAIENAGYQIVMTVHDEVVAETTYGTSDELATIMATNPSWADGLPLSAAGFDCLRYRKD
jgi:DNA polymerase